MSQQDSDAEKTEEPTPQRKAKVRQEGNVPRSRELTSLLMLLVGWGLIVSGGDLIARRLALLLHSGLSFDRMLLLDASAMARQLRHLLVMAATSVVPLLLGLLLTGLVAPMLLGGINFSAKSLKVDLKRLNPLSGLKRMVSAQMVSELLKSVLKVALVATAAGLFLYASKHSLLQLSAMPPGEALGAARGLIAGCLLMVILALIPMVGYDVFWQIFSHLKKLRMTRQEIRDEMKQTEGNPHIKGRIRQLQRAAARSRMMSEVPKADVIITNPTHYAVALNYREGTMAAPVLLAKGAGETALKIRELGREHRIPTLEAPPLARALFRHCEPGEPIPGELYSAVAEVLAWVYGLRQWRQNGGTAPAKPTNLPVPAALDFPQESQE
ncbi:flagellar biosynthesis protein FlhB [Entomohabitans teleogrylli]|uniref:flagellar biosynthesis protein FlhB n=1 Tax=Entomohabitans teleogrylli TaxID=1384589 RepID=UPI00073D2196|nr:flagellar biosynthesis protein FlhB [Entomohabitans teleogrylli]